MTGPSRCDILLTICTGQRARIRACEVGGETTSKAGLFKRVQQTSSKASRTRVEGQGADEAAEDVRRYVDGRQQPKFLQRLLP
jgi:hypothetical protein